MCVLLCAGADVRHWFDIPAARAYREALQASAVCVTSLGAHTSNLHDPQSHTIGESEADVVIVQRVMKQATWRHAYCAYRARLAGHRRRLAEASASARDWPKALEAIAKTWGRLLSLVGLRW